MGEPPIFEDKILAKLIDPVLKDGDMNNHGMIDYSEFISAAIRNQKGEGPVIELSSCFRKKQNNSLNLVDFFCIFYKSSVFKFVRAFCEKKQSDRRAYLVYEFIYFLRILGCI